MKYLYSLAIVLAVTACTTNPGAESSLETDNRNLRLQIDSLINENRNLKKGLPVSAVSLNETTNKISSQCMGVTKKGKRCSRSVKSGSYCWQHKKS